MPQGSDTISEGEASKAALELTLAVTETAKYSPSQPRVPAGSEGGGRWRGGPGGGYSALQKQGAAGGFSITTHGDVPKDGYMVSPYKEAELAIPMGQFTRKTVRDFERQHADLLGKPDHYMGGWRDGDTFYIDISVRAATKAAAKKIAVGADQLAVYDVGNGTTINTGDL